MNSSFYLEPVPNLPRTTRPSKTILAVKNEYIASPTITSNASCEAEIYHEPVFEFFNPQPIQIFSKQAKKLTTRLLVSGLLLLGLLCGAALLFAISTSNFF
jgi:hypothetical protein